MVILSLNEGRAVRRDIFFSLYAFSLRFLKLCTQSKEKIMFCFFQSLVRSKMANLQCLIQLNFKVSFLHKYPMLMPVSYALRKKQSLSKLYHVLLF